MRVLQTGAKTIGTSHRERAAGRLPVGQQASTPSVIALAEVATPARQSTRTGQRKLAPVRLRAWPLFPRRTRPNNPAVLARELGPCADGELGLA